MGIAGDIVETLIDLMKDNDEFKGVGSYYRRLDYNRNTLAKRACFIFPHKEELQNPGFQDTYEYRLRVIIAFTIPWESGSNDDRRAIHEFDDAIKELLIKNRQPATAPIVSIDWMVQETIYSGPLVIEFDEDDVVMIDIVEHHIDVDYARVVTQ